MRITHITVLVTLVIACISCEQQRSVREYDEIRIIGRSSSDEMPLGLPSMAMKADTKIDKIIDDSAIKSGMQWETPQDWVEKGSSGMRLMTFTKATGGIECTIVALKGMAGGLEGNIIRWLRQIQLTPSKSDLASFMANAYEVESKGNVIFKIFDFNKLQANKADKADSMYVAFAQHQGQSIFIKMTGSKQSVHNNNNNFMQLVASIHSQ